ncbi:pyridoxine/pyridoxamine 5'-phosphate oxidase isoform X2 [Aethina tumida]|nr:pyridoxine/pyridoxamine 5'-phosphate oxidase isoform X2 [Aethina tumida]
MTDSDLSYICVKKNLSPIQLFEKWLEESKTYGKGSQVFNLATADKEGNVSNRNIILRDIKDNCLIFTANRLGNKTTHIELNPNVAACFLWMYSKDESFISRQVRLEGRAEEIPKSDLNQYFDTEPLYCQLRYHICDQSQPVHWKELKAKHDKLYSQTLEQPALPVAENYIGYKIIPNKWDFYHADGNTIADRITFTLDKGTESWIKQRVAA